MRLDIFFMKKFSERLQSVINQYDISPADLSKKMGFKQPSRIYRLLSGEHLPSFEFLEDFSQTFTEVNIEWLVTGNGEMLKKVQVLELHGGGHERLINKLLTDQPTASGWALPVENWEKEAEKKVKVNTNQLAESQAVYEHLIAKPKHEGKILFKAIEASKMNTAVLAKKIHFADSTKLIQYFDCEEVNLLVLLRIGKEIGFDGLMSINRIQPFVLNADIVIKELSHQYKYFYDFMSDSIDEINLLKTKVDKAHQIIKEQDAKIDSVIASLKKQPNNQ
jgi:transcriptional regulator with XRE-family HTH domain